MLRLVAATVVLIGLLTACGGPQASPAAGTELTVRYAADGKSAQTWTLTCDPPGGSHPHPDDACAALARDGDEALPSVPAGKVCSQQYGGPQTATITGTRRGQTVETKLSRTDGCQIDRWNRLAGLVPAVG